MAELSAQHFLGIGIIIALITAIGVLSGRKVKDSGDFLKGGGSAGFVVVSGSIIGGIIGGSATLGTAQLAETNGLSGWWFTLGAGIGCILYGLIYVKRMRQSACITLPEIISAHFGQAVRPYVSILSSIGVFIGCIAQILSGSVLLSSLLPLEFHYCMALTMVLAGFYVVFGGVWGSGAVGFTKFVLMAGTTLACIALVLSLGDTPATYWNALSHPQYFNLFSRGIEKDFSAGVSVILGVFSSQTYMQAVISAKSDKVALQGMYLCAAIAPLIGLGSIIVGLYMHTHYPAIPTVAAFPQFVLIHFPPLLAGVVLATLFISALGTASGVALSIAAVIVNDIYKVRAKERASEKTLLRISRLSIVGVLLVAGTFAFFSSNGTILGWGILTMALRSVVVFPALCLALIGKPAIHSNYINWGMVAGMAVALIGNVAPFEIEPIFPGLLVNIAILCVGYFRGRAKPHESLPPNGSVNS